MNKHINRETETEIDRETCAFPVLSAPELPLDPPLARRDDDMCRSLPAEPTLLWLMGGGIGEDLKLGLAILGRLGGRRMVCCWAEEWEEEDEEWEAGAGERWECECEWACGEFVIELLGLLELAGTWIWKLFWFLLHHVSKSLWSCRLAFSSRWCACSILLLVSFNLIKSFLYFCFSSSIYFLNSNSFSSGGKEPPESLFLFSDPSPSKVATPRWIRYCSICWMSSWIRPRDALTSLFQN